MGAEALHGRWADGEVGIVDGAGACTDFEPKEFLSVKEIRRLDRFSQLALVAASEAFDQAGWNGELPYESLRIGCVVATGIGGIQTVETQHDVMRDRGAKMVSPLGIPQYMPNAAAAAVSMKYGLQGQMYGIVSACSSGGHAIGSALRMIQYGDADAVLVGGAEATLTAFGYACFNSMQALSPTGMSRPFDRRRDGFVMGEGAGMLVLEDAEAAQARGAQILAEVVGYGSTADAHHLTAPDPSGIPAARAGERIRGGLRQRAWHVDAAQRRGRDRGVETRVWRGRGEADPRVLHEVGHRPSPGRRGRGRGRGHDDDAHDRRHPAHARLRGARPRARSRLRARRGAAAARGQRRTAGRRLELVRLRRP
jgi:3-oxoacyl-(acyl-carrier-protein) synthase